MTSTPLDRRGFLKGSAALLGSLTAGATFQAYLANAAHAQPARGARGLRSVEAPDNGGYGPLVATGPELHLPRDFSYVAFGRTGEIMSDGIPTPGAHDGMASFPGPNGTVRLVRNHEQSGGGAYGTPAYDSLAGGGTTNLVYDPATRSLVTSYASLTGTVRNCAGGPMPWGSWLTCEETFDGPAQGYEQQHGYVFEVPADANGPVEPVPLKAMGRFVHEAVAIDAATGIIYETEDRGASGFYRFIPDTPGDLRTGRLQMLAIFGRPQYDTRSGQRVGVRMPTTWVDIDEPDPQGTDALAVYNQGFAKGGATFDRLEGAWPSDDAIYFDSTSGGDASLGQIWEYKPRGRSVADRGSEGQLTLVFESPSRDLLEAPDNICISPKGSIVICEDGGGTDYLRVINPRGQIFDLGMNALNGSELAGANFSPDGDTLFVNIQTPGITFAITGPWDRGPI